MKGSYCRSVPSLSIYYRTSVICIKGADLCSVMMHTAGDGLTPSDHPGAFRVRFDAKVAARSQKGEFPLDTVSTVFVTNRDGCSYMEAPVSDKGMLSVDFNMLPLSAGLKLTDRIKFHFFFRDVKDGMLKPISAAHMTLVELADHVKDGGFLDACSNFNSNSITMTFVPSNEHSRSMHIDLLRLYNTDNVTPSVLVNSNKHLSTIKTLSASVSTGLLEKTEVTTENGGNMFQSVFTAHMMENEATLYSLYHLDFDGPQNVPPWLCTYLLAETLHHNSVTIEQVKSMNNGELTQFAASYAQGPMRSASAAPYTMDMTVSEDPALFRTSNGTALSEVFKRPFSHPYMFLKKGHGALITDDCEGLAAFVRDISNHLGYAFTTHSDDFKQTDTYVRYNNLMKSYFPKDLFGLMTSQYQNKLMDLVLFLGEHFAKKTIECKITLVSANGASMGGEGAQRQIQAHACASMICNDPAHPISVMLEGTACLTDDQHSKHLVINGSPVMLADIANSLSVTPPFNAFMGLGKSSVRVAFHVTHSKGSFYRTAFCENDSMLGSQIGSAPVQFGVDMEYLADDAVKVYMPVTGKTTPPGSYDALKQYISARAAEIHLPLVDHNLIRENLRWAPMTQFKGCKELIAGRPFTTCMVHVLAATAEDLDELLHQANVEAAAFNVDPKFSKIGAMRAFASMDGVSKLLHLYSDDTTALQACLGTPSYHAAANTRVTS